MTLCRLRLAMIHLSLIVIVGSFAGCGPHQQEPAARPDAPASQVVNAPQVTPGSDQKGTQATFPLTITDARGKKIEIKASPRHIVSLAPSLTEIVYALHRENSLVADTVSCDYPPEARNKPHIDPLRPDREKIEINEPDLVIAQSKLNSTTLIESLERDHIPVLVVSANTLEETYKAIETIGEATGTTIEAESLAHQMRAQIDLIKQAVATATDRPKVLIMYSDSPIYTTGQDSYITEVINAAGGQNIVKEPLPNGVIASAVVVERQPDVILCDPTLAAKARNLPGWSVIPAVKNNRFFHTSSKTTLVRPGPRLPVAVEELARYLHPDVLK